LSFVTICKQLDILLEVVVSFIHYLVTVRIMKPVRPCLNYDSVVYDVSHSSLTDSWRHPKLTLKQGFSVNLL